MWLSTLGPPRQIQAPSVTRHLWSLMYLWQAMNKPMASMWWLKVCGRFMLVVRLKLVHALPCCISLRFFLKVACARKRTSCTLVGKVFLPYSSGKWKFRAQTVSRHFAAFLFQSHLGSIRTYRQMALTSCSICWVDWHGALQSLNYCVNCSCEWRRGDWRTSVDNRTSCV